MNFLKKAMDTAQNKSSGSSSNTAHQSGSGVNNGQKADYGDKAFDFLSKKAGYNVDPNKRETLTDGGRTVYEKMTGYVFLIYNLKIVLLMAL